jgi:dTDP-4-amino-4,6-dideoxygalactose transaminase
MINWWNTSFGDEEIQSITNAIQNKNIGMGKVTELFEEKMAKFLDVKYAIAVPNGSIALFIALKSIGISSNDEVIIPNRTFIATANAVKLAGAKVVLVDVNKDNTNIDIKKIESKITPNTKAVIPVHLNGRAVNMEKISTIAKKHNLFVIEDTAQALASKYKNRYLGTFGDIGCFSLGLAKLLNVGYGGLLVTNDEKLYKKIKKFRNHNIGFENDKYDELGFNFKISDITTSIGITQLQKLPKKIAHLKKIYSLYEKEFKKLDYIKLIRVNTKNEIPLYIEVVSKYKKDLMKFLQQNEIETKELPPSLHLSNHLKQKGKFKNSIYFDKYSFILPSGPNQEIKNIKKTIKVIKKFKKGLNVK